MVGTIAGNLLLLLILQAYSYYLMIRLPLSIILAGAPMDMAKLHFLSEAPETKFCDF
jgi:hypothetical protein